jgi:hypothetical protein
MGRASSLGCVGLHTVGRSCEVVERSRWLRAADDGQWQLATSTEVDGHDLGAGEFNIFIFADDPSDTFHRIQGLRETRSLSARMSAAYRLVDGEDYTSSGRVI